MDYENIEVAPSKGDFPRTIDPSTVPYSYGDCYNQDAFFPSENVELREPYIIRDFRGQTVAFHPFLYNAVNKTLRVYYNMTIEVYKTGEIGNNELSRNEDGKVNIIPDFEEIYSRRFINYEQVKKSMLGAAKYNPVAEGGDMLIICHDAFIDAMSDFVTWKKTRGVNTTIVGTSTAGNSYTAIKSYIQSQYAANNNLTYVLLVGDVDQIPGYPFNYVNPTSNGLSDNIYGQIVGDDIYNDLFVGRFSAQTAEQAFLQAEKVIIYERYLDNSNTWCQKGMVISEGNSSMGHYNEYDWQHLNKIREDLLNYGYYEVYQEFDGVSGYYSTPSQIVSEINDGVGLINYCGHGTETSWHSHDQSINNAQINNLVNDYRLPIIYSVACYNGKYDSDSGDCFAEAWMHAHNNANGNPTGAIATFMTYINQPWNPPMYAQDEFIDIVVESYSDNIRHTLGGTIYNSILCIFDYYAPDDNDAKRTYQSWILFGDPSLTIRTKTPNQVPVAHSPNIVIENSSLIVSAPDADGSTAVITNADLDIIGLATVSDGIATINSSADLTPGEALTLCFSGYNKVSRIDTITAVSSVQHNISYVETQHGSVSGPNSAYSSSTVTLTVTPESGYHISEWDIQDAYGNSIATIDSTGPASLGNHFVMPNSNTTVNATFVENGSVILASVENGVINASPLSADPGATIYLSAVADEGYVFGEWIVRRSDDTTTLINVSNDSFTMPEVDVIVSAIFLPARRINIASVRNGTISANLQYALPGETISLSAQPDSNHALGRWYVYNTNDIDTEIAVSANSFIMPDFDVTVAALFIYTYTQNDTANNGDERPSMKLPICVSVNYSFSQQIYTPDEVGEAGLITSLSFLTNLFMEDTVIRNIDIYISHTTENEFSGPDSWIHQSEADLYHSGIDTIFVPQWTTFKLDRPFAYDGTSNLLITVDDNTGSYVLFIKFITHVVDGNRSICISSDDINFDPDTISSVGELLNTTNNIIFHKGTDNESHISLSSDSISDFQYQVGCGPSEAKSIGIIGSNIFGTLNITAPDCFEVSDAADGIFSSSIQLEPSSSKIRDMLFFRLKADLEEGTYRQHATLAADNLQDSIALDGHVWDVTNIQLAKEEPFVFFNGNEITINGTGELQIIDLMGRYISKFYVHNSQVINPSKTFPNSGVYILRLCGDSIRTQKVVIHNALRQ